MLLYNCVFVFFVIRIHFLSFCCICANHVEIKSYETFFVTKYLLNIQSQTDTYYIVLWYFLSHVLLSISPEKWERGECGKNILNITYSRWSCGHWHLMPGRSWSEETVCILNFSNWYWNCTAGKKIKKSPGKKTREIK